MPTRSITVLLTLPMLVAGLAGCQQARSGGALSGQTIEVIATWSGGEQETFVEVLNLFERQTGANVRYISGGDDLSTLVQTRIKGGNPPNVAISPQPGVMIQLAKSNALKPLDAAVIDLVDRNYAPVWKRLGTVDGKLYSVYFKANNKSTVWYSERVLSENGLEPPKSWAEFLDLCTSLSNLGISPVSVGAADGWVLTDWFENIYLQINGPELYDQLSEHKIDWTHESVRKALDTLRQFFRHDMFIYRGRAGALQTNYENSVVNVFGPQARAAMVYEGDFVASVINNETNVRVGNGAKFFMFPSINGDGPARAVVGGDAAFVLKDDAATTEFMKFLASPQAGAEWAKHGGFLSPNQLMSPTSYPDKLTEEIAEPLVNGDSEIRFDMSDLYPPQFGAAKGVGAWKAMQDFFAEPDNIDAVMNQLETAADAATP